MLSIQTSYMWSYLADMITQVYNSSKKVAIAIISYLCKRTLSAFAPGKIPIKKVGNVPKLETEGKNLAALGFDPRTSGLTLSYEPGALPLSYAAGFVLYDLWKTN
jgi:hypothetical protein